MLRAVRTDILHFPARVAVMPMDAPCPYQIFRTCWARCGCGLEADTFSGKMTALIVAVLASCRTTIRSRLELAAEVLALRHQLAVLQRTAPTRPRLRPIDRL